MISFLLGNAKLENQSAESRFDGGVTTANFQTQTKNEFAGNVSIKPNNYEYFISSEGYFKGLFFYPLRKRTKHQIWSSGRSQFIEDRRRRYKGYK